MKESTLEITTPKNSLLSALITEQLANNEKLLEFLRNHVTIEELLQDRPAQAEIDADLITYFSHDSNKRIKRMKESGIYKIKNTYPLLILHRKDNPRKKVARSPFMLKDGRYFYYFDNYFQEELPPYLRAEDAVPSPMRYETQNPAIRSQVARQLGISQKELDFRSYEFDPEVIPYLFVHYPFTKAINRVLVNGGEAERYNYNTDQWEPNADGIYKLGPVAVLRKVRRTVTKG